MQETHEPRSTGAVKSTHASQSMALPTWNSTDARRAIVAFVDTVTQEGSAGFVPPAARIAVFDNDGTLWPENPVPFQLAFVMDGLQQQLPANPAWATDPFVKAALAGDFATLEDNGYSGLLHVLGLTHAGMTTDEFAALVPQSTGKLVDALEAAPQRGWVVVDMERDWRVVLA